MRSVALALAAAALAAPAFAQGQQYSGMATFYDTETGNAGSCGSMLSNSDNIVALNSPMYDSNTVTCGQEICITGGYGQATARVADRCPETDQCHWGSLDLAKNFFNTFASSDAGVIPITWTVGACGSSSPPPPPPPPPAWSPIQYVTPAPAPWTPEWTPSPSPAWTPDPTTTTSTWTPSSSSSTPSSSSSRPSSSSAAPASSSGATLRTNQANNAVEQGGNLAALGNIVGGIARLNYQAAVQV